eukprot:4261324-Pyramimonas_sp.AAC.1
MGLGLRAFRSAITFAPWRRPAWGEGNPLAQTAKLRALRTPSGRRAGRRRTALRSTVQNE